MSLSKIDPSDARQLMSCPLRQYRCKNSFPTNQLDQHNTSNEHLRSIIDCLKEYEQKHDEASIKLTMNLWGVDDPLNEAAAAVKEGQQFFGEITQLISQHIQPSSATNSARDISPNFDPIYNRNSSAAKQHIERQDRTTDDMAHLECNQAEFQLSTNQMNTIPTRNSDVEQDGGASALSEAQQLLNQTHQTISFLRTELESKPVSTDGLLIWNISINPTIIDAKYKRSYINSPPFETSMCGYRLWARLYPQSNTDRHFMSISVRLYPPCRHAFQGIVKFLLVDQSKDPPWEHHMKICRGNIIDVGECLCVNDFIEHRFILQADNRYVCDDSICIIVKVEQTTQEKLMNYQPNIQNALECLQ